MTKSITISQRISKELKKKIGKNSVNPMTAFDHKYLK